MTNYFEQEPMRYWALPTMSSEARELHIEKMIAQKTYWYSEKIDGNWSRVIITPNKSAIQTRGISKKTGTYGEVQDRILYWDDIVNSFNDTTVFLAEIYLDGGIDRNVGSILRALPDKSKSIQSNEYYEKCRKNVKFSKREVRDIEENEFRNKILKLYVFDVLCYNGQELQDLPLEDRITYIPKILKDIGNSNIRGAKYTPMDETFYDKITKIFKRDGEGVVCYDKTAPYVFGSRTAWKTCKIKQEITNLIDCFIIGTDPAVKEYGGKEIEHWPYWEDMRTGEKINSEMFIRYQKGELLIPVTKNYFYNFPGDIRVGVFDDDNNIIELCHVGGLTEEFKTELRDKYEKYHMCPVTVGGMMISEADGLSVRHPILKSIREGDIDIKDCTLRKIKGDY